MVVGITWPVPAELDDSALEAWLFSPPFARGRNRNWPRLHAELRRPGVTLLLLWESIEQGNRKDMATAVMLRPYLCCSWWREPGMPWGTLARSAT